MADLMLKVTLRGFEPDDQQAENYRRALKPGTRVRATVKIPRYGPHHRMVFALLQLTYSNLPERYASIWPSFEHFRKAVAVEAGHFEEVISRSGEVFRIPGSLSFDALDELQFDRVSKAMLRVCADVLGVDEPELAQEVERAAA
jgi:hypothetical protein